MPVGDGMQNDFDFFYFSLVFDFKRASQRSRRTSTADHACALSMSINNKSEIKYKAIKAFIGMAKW